MKADELQMANNKKASLINPESNASQAKIIINKKKFLSQGCCEGKLFVSLIVLLFFDWKRMCLYRSTV